MESSFIIIHGELALKPEPRCPFYGMHYVSSQRLFVDSRGNQCSLVTCAYAPCKMEVQSEEIDWNKCHFNSKEGKRTVEEMLDSTTVFPPNLQQGTGISLRDWYDHIMDGKEIPGLKQRTEILKDHGKN
ncbi:MAG: hypothetical protein WC796_03900 [Candidatus Pacearchaeota archaeon]